MELPAGEDGGVGDADFLDFFEVEEARAVGEGVQRHDAQQAGRGRPGRAERSWLHFLRGCGDGSAGGRIIRPGGSGIVASGVSVGANRADVVRDRSARSMRMVSRVVRGRGPAADASVTRSYQWAGGAERQLLQPVEQEGVVAEERQAVAAGVEFAAQATADAVFEIGLPSRATTARRLGQEFAANRGDVPLCVLRSPKPECFFRHFLTRVFGIIDFFLSSHRVVVELLIDGLDAAGTARGHRPPARPAARRTGGRPDRVRLAGTLPS